MAISSVSAGFAAVFGAGGLRPGFATAERTACQTIADLTREHATAERHASLEADAKQARAILGEQRTVTGSGATVAAGRLVGVELNPEAVDVVKPVLTAVMVELLAALLFAGAVRALSGVEASGRVLSASAAAVVSTAAAPTTPIPPMPADTGTDRAEVVSATVSPPSEQTPALQGSEPVRLLSATCPLPTGPDGRLLDLLKARGGELSGGLRTIGDAIGLGRTATSDLLDELAASGRVVVESGRRGTTVRLLDRLNEAPVTTVH